MSKSLDELVSGFSKNQLIGFFLILWAVSFLFSSLNGFINIAQGYGSTLDMIVDALWSIVEIGCGAVLIMLGLKTLNEKQ